MASLFAVTTTTGTVRLDEDRQGEAVFTVFNASGRPVQGRALIQVLDPAAAPWVGPIDAPVQQFEPSGTHQYRVPIKAPPDAPQGDYTFRLNMVGEENPDEFFTEGPAVTFQLPEPTPQRKPFPWWIIAAAIVLLLLVGGGLFFLLNRNTEVPEVAGMQVEVAGEAIRDAGLAIGVSLEQPSGELGAGRVISTNPAEGQTVSRGTRVALLVSSGAPGPVTVQVPDVAGFSLNDAVTTLQTSGLRFEGVAQSFSAEIPSGQIIRTDPAAGTQVLEGTEVTIIQSGGPPPPETLTLPDLRDQPAAAAQQALEQACPPAPCVTVNTSTENSGTIAAQRVVRSQPPSGSLVERGSAVTLVVSSGPAQVIIPDVRNQIASAARAQLEGLCEPQPCVTVTMNQPAGPGRIFVFSQVSAQNPSPGATVLQGSQVNLTLSSVILPPDAEIQLQQFGPDLPRGFQQLDPEILRQLEQFQP
jgi:beta-lactam-binding protein with PASTA domain